MIISFCGHRDFIETEDLKIKFFSVINKVVGNEPVDFYLGGYGAFDYFAFRCCKEFRRTHDNVKIFYITPYLEPERISKIEIGENSYDGVIFFDLENVPLKYRIVRRNYEMVKSSDFIISYVKYNFGGARKTLNFAIKLNKKYVNLI